MFGGLFSLLPGWLTSSPYFIVFVVIVVPLVGFALYLRFFLRPRSAATPQAVPQQDATQATQTQATQAPDRAEELAKAVGQLGSKIDRVEANVTKALASGFGEVMGELRNLSQKLEDAVLAIKAAQSDAASPFNEQPKQPEAPPVAAEAAWPVDRGGAHENGALSGELGGYDITRLLEACAILEILGYNRRQVELLFEVGLLGVEHLELVGRVERVLEKYGSGLRARDVAEIVLKTCPPQAVSQQGVVRILRVLRELGGADGGRSGE